MITLKSCPICKSRNIAENTFKSLGPYVECEIMPNVKVKGMIVTRSSICQDCTVIFQNPRLSNSELDRFYAEGYYRKMMDKASKGDDKYEKTRAEIDAEIIRSYTGGVETHLDIGCGRGYILNLFDATKAKVGVEPDKEYVIAKGVKIYPDTKHVPHKTYDLVTALHLLEHVVNPLRYLQEIVRFLGDGYAAIEVPYGPDFAKTPDFVHLYHFEPSVLKQMCSKVGLRVLQIHFTPHLLLICKKQNDHP
jgi:SAM-dependent methyltransferase